MYRTGVLFTVMLCAGLFVLLLVAPGVYVGGYGASADAGADFMGRRASPMFAGLAVMLWMMRDAPASPQRAAVCMGMSVIWGGIAVTGLFELIRGTAGMMILAAIVVEVILAGLFGWLTRAKG